MRYPPKEGGNASNGINKPLPDAAAATENSKAQQSIDLSAGEAPANPETVRFNKSQLDEADTRRLQRGVIFVTIYAAAIFVFFTFMAFIWGQVKPFETKDEGAGLMLLWLLAILPVVLFLLMMRLAAEPNPNDEKPLPIGQGILGILQELATALKDFLKSKTGGSS